MVWWCFVTVVMMLDRTNYVHVCPIEYQYACTSPMQWVPCRYNVIHWRELYYAILYSSKVRSQRSDNDETGSDIDLFLLSQDIESAIERFLPSSMHADDGHSPRSIPNDAQLAKEEFLPAKLNEWSGTCSNDEGILITCSTSIRIATV